jgi:hypothetical protein
MSPFHLFFFSSPGFGAYQPSIVYNEKLMQFVYLQFGIVMETEVQHNGVESQICDDQVREKREQQQKKRREAYREKHGSDDTYEHYQDECEEEDGGDSGTFHSHEPCTENREVGGKQKASPFCWLCEYQGNRTTNEVIRFIMENIPHMALDSLITQSKYLLDRVDVGSNCTIAQIKMHVTSHMLHPRVKLALQLLDMVKMQQDVSKCCVVDDVEQGGKTINPQAMRVYLTLCTQVTAVYKMGEDKLTFNQSAVDK